MAKACGIGALAFAFVAIFVLGGSVIFSPIATVLAVLAAIGGEHRYAMWTSAIVAVNAVVFSPFMWILMMPPGQWIVAAFVLGLVAAPLGAIALDTYVHDKRIAIVLSIFWALGAPLALYEEGQKWSGDRFGQIERACKIEHGNVYTPAISGLCYKRAQGASATSFTATTYLLAAFVPVGLGWLLATTALFLWRRRKHPKPSV